MRRPRCLPDAQLLTSNDGDQLEVESPSRGVARSEVRMRECYIVSVGAVRMFTVTAHCAITCVILDRNMISTSLWQHTLDAKQELTFHNSSGSKQEHYLQ